MQEFISYFKNKKNLINLLVLAIMVLGVPLGVNLARQQQILKSQAGGGPIAFVGDSVKVKDGKWIALKPKITLQLTSDLGPPLQTGIGSSAPIITSLPSLMSILPKGVVGKVLAQEQKVPGFATMPGGNAGEGCSVDQWAIIPPNPGPGQEFQITIKKGSSNRGWKAGGFARMWDGGDLSCHFSETNNTQTANIVAPNSPGNYKIEYRVDNLQCGGEEEDPPDSADTCDRKTINVVAGGGNSGPGDCTVEWQLSNEKPQPNSPITVTVQGLKSAPSGWAGLTLLMDGQAVGNPQIDDSGVKPKFTYQNINSGTSGKHTLSFAVKDGQTVCQLPKEFQTGPGPSPSPSPSPIPSPSPSPSAPPVFTKEFRVAESKGALEKKDWILYTETPMEHVFKFEDKNPGPKKVCVQFRATNGKTSDPFCADIRLLGEDPAISSCSLNFEGSNVVFDIKGKNFGATKGSAKSGETALQIKEWKDTSLKLTFPNAPVGQSFPITLTNTDEQVGEGQCSAFSTISLGAKVFCRAPSSHDSDNVEMILVGLFEGAKKTKDKVKIDRNGNIANLTQRLEEGKKYLLSLKAPRSLRRVTEEFTASSGTTNIPNFALPVGDIFPADGGDGKINTLDKAELNRQWIAGQSSSGRSGDFNLDSRVNSIDWACMRYDFGQEDASEPLPGVPAASPVPVPSPSPSPVATSSASPSPGT